MKHFCTYFDSNYALRGLALFRSMQKHCGEFVLHVLCCDDQAFALVEALGVKNLLPVRLSEVEAFEPRLPQVKPTRSRVEYLWTLSPIWPLFLLETHTDIDLICYLDADLFFFSSDAAIWEEFGDASILLIEHRFPLGQEVMLGNGRFNVGMMAYRRDANGLMCLNWYRERCLEWCFNRHEEERFGDQKYLDDFPRLFEGVHVLQHPGVNAAPWNWMNGPLQVGADGHWTIKGQPLIFYHFHGLKILNPWLFDASSYATNYGEMPRFLARRLHSIYTRALIQTARWVRSRGHEICWNYARVGVDYHWRMYISKLRRGRMIFQRGLR